MEALVLFGLFLFVGLCWLDSLPHYFWIKRDDPYWRKKGRDE